MNMKSSVKPNQSSVKQGTLGYMAQNPLYLVLSSHLGSRSQIFRLQRDLYNYLWAVLPFAKGRRSKEMSKFIAHELEEAAQKAPSLIITETLLSFALGVKVLRLQGKRENKRTSEHLHKLLAESQTRNWLNAPEAVGILTFALGDIEYYGQWVQAAREWLNTLWTKTTQSRRQGTSLLIDILFGLAMTESKPANIPHNLLLADLPKHSIEKVAKLVIALKQIGNEPQVNTAVEVLQSKLAANIDRWFSPGIELVARESAHLLASGLSEAETQQILSSLKKEGVPWAQALELGEKRISITNVEPTNSAEMSAPEESLSCLALRATGLDKGYHLTDSQHRVALESIKVASRKGEFIAASRRGLSTIAWLSVVTAVLPFVVGMVDARQVLEHIAAGLNPGQALLGLFTTNFSLPGVLAVLYLLYIIFYLRVLFVFRSKGRVLKWWELIPGLLWLGKQFRIVEPEKGD